MNEPKALPVLDDVSPICCAPLSSTADFSLEDETVRAFLHTVGSEGLPLTETAVGGCCGARTRRPRKARTAARECDSRNHGEPVRIVRTLTQTGRANLRGSASEHVRQHRVHLRATSILLTHEQNLGHRVVDGTLRLHKRSQSIRRGTGRVAGEMGETAECSQVAEVSRDEADQIVAGSSSARRA